jgi:hypothetical protein
MGVRIGLAQCFLLFKECCTVGGMKQKKIKVTAKTIFPVMEMNA